jgi:adenylate cyclase
MASFNLQLYVEGKLSRRWTSEAPVSVGRQDRGEPEVGPHAGIEGNRAIVASLAQREVPRRYFDLTVDSQSKPLLRNVNPQLDLMIQGLPTLRPGTTLPIVSGVTLIITPKISLHVEPDTRSDLLRTLSGHGLHPDAASLASLIANSALSKAGHRLDTAVAADTLKLLQHVLPVIRESATSDSFFQAGAVAALRIAGLDRAVVFLFSDNQRICRAEAYREPIGTNRGVCGESFGEPLTSIQDASRLSASAPSISGSIISCAQASAATTLYEPGGDTAGLGQSVQHLHQAICAPILNKQAQVIGVLYGDRWTGTPAQHGLEVEAKLVEILAGAIAAGLARQAEERQRSSMELFFSDVVARHIAADTHLLEPKEEQVTLMFCDVRGFSSISKHLGASRTIQWMQDVFTLISRCVEEHAGVVVNYVGDEVFAMWGAPESRADHAACALRSAQKIMQCLPEVELAWRDALNQPLRIGIGINSGLAAVGNTGSKTKFQYGAFGNSVNLASRLQSATKHFGVQCLVSEATACQCDTTFPLRELATIEVLGIDEPVVIKQLNCQSSEQWQSLCRAYESALCDYRHGRFAEATKILGDILKEHPDDEPSMRLLSLSVAQLRQPSPDFNAIDKLASK